MALLLEQKNYIPKAVILLRSDQYQEFLKEKNDPDERLVRDPSILIISSSNTFWYKDYECFESIKTASEDFNEAGMLVLERNDDGKPIYRRIPIIPESSESIFANPFSDEIIRMSRAIVAVAQNLGASSVEVEFEASKDLKGRIEASISVDRDVSITLEEDCNKDEAIKADAESSKRANATLRKGGDSSNFVSYKIESKFSKGGGYNLQEGIKIARNILIQNKMDNIAELQSLISGRSGRNLLLEHKETIDFANSFRSSVEALVNVGVKKSVMLPKIFGFSAGSSFGAQFDYLREMAQKTSIKIKVRFDG